jgi:hypothetical protein
VAKICVVALDAVQDFAAENLEHEQESKKAKDKALKMEEDVEGGASWALMMEEKLEEVQS